MPTNEEADRTYELALAALRNTIADPDITEDQRRIAQQKRDRLILDFIGQAIASIDARTAKFRAFIREMEEVIAEFDPEHDDRRHPQAQGGGRRGCRAGLGGHRDTRPGRSGDVAAHRPQRSRRPKSERRSPARGGCATEGAATRRPAASAKPRSKAKVKGKAATPVARKRAAKKPAVRKRVAKKAAAAKKPRAKRPRARRR